MTKTLPSAMAQANLVALTQNPAGRKIGVFGMGVTGVAMALYLARRGASVRCVDARLDIAPLAEDVLRTLPIVMRLGDVPAHVFDGCDGVAASPGIAPDHPAVQATLAQNKPVFGELELCVPLPAPCIAITGTNGKSTTTALVGTLIRGVGKTAFVGGNLGDPIARWLDAHQAVDVRGAIAAGHAQERSGTDVNADADADADVNVTGGRATDVAVLELSSYQIDLAYRFAPEVAVVLNLSPDHLARYKTFDNYAASKARLVQLTPASGLVILNYDDAVVRDMAQMSAAPIWWLTCAQPSLPDGLDGAAYDAARDCLVFAGTLAHLRPWPMAHPRLLGAHNKHNSAAALLAVLALYPQTSLAALSAAYAAFTGLEHRLEWAGDLDEVSYINDSKATNDASAATAVRAMQRPCILLAGGVDKGGGYKLLVGACLHQRMRQVIAFGQAASLIALAMAQLEVPVAHVTSLEDALAYARRVAEPGDVVLMAPACSSFDAYADYRHRGHAFKDWVRRQGARA